MHRKECRKGRYRHRSSIWWLKEGIDSLRKYWPLIGAQIAVSATHYILLLRADVCIARVCRGKTRTIVESPVVSGNTRSCLIGDLLPDPPAAFCLVLLLPMRATLPGEWSFLFSWSLHNWCRQGIRLLPSSFSKVSASRSSETVRPGILRMFLSDWVVQCGSLVAVIFFIPNIRTSV